MKHFKISFYALIFMGLLGVLTFTACEQEQLQIGNAPEASTMLLKDIRVEHQNGVLKFEGGEKFFAEFELLNKVTPEELVAFTNELGFESYLSAVTDAYAELEDISSLEGMESFKRTYSHLFIFEDGHVKQKIENLAYAAITNIDGMVLIGNYAMKVEHNRIIEELNGDLERLQRLNLLSELNTVADLNVINYEDFSRNQCPNPSTAFRTRSDNKRKVLFDIQVYPISCGCCGQYRGFYKIRARGYKKSFGSWRSYKTQLQFECVDFEVLINGARSIISNASAATSSDAKELKRTGWIGNIHLNYPSLQLDKVRGRASSRGVGNIWAVICCDYGNSCPSNSGSAGSNNCY